MASLNVSLPDQLREWVTQQVDSGNYSSASDYLRDLIRADKRNQGKDMQWLGDHLRARGMTPDHDFVEVSAEDVKSRMRRKVERDT